MHHFIFAITLSNHIIFRYFLAYRYWSKFATKLQQNCPPILTAVLTLPCEIKQVNLLITAVTYALKVMTVTEKHYSKCSVFAFGFETCIKTILPLISRLINEAPLVADHVSISIMLLQRINVSHWFLINIFGFNLCLQELVHWCGFHASRGESEWCIILWCLAAQTVPVRHLSCVHKSTELQRHKISDFTPDVASQQTRPQYSVHYRLIGALGSFFCVFVHFMYFLLVEFGSHYRTCAVDCSELQSYGVDFEYL